MLVKKKYWSSLAFKGFVSKIVQFMSGRDKGEGVVFVGRPQHFAKPIPALSPPRKAHGALFELWEERIGFTRRTAFCYAALLLRLHAGYQLRAHKDTDPGGTSNG